MNKKKIDIVSIICLLITLASGIMLHMDVHHRHIYDNTLLWGTHETFGIILAMALGVHCLQHKYWFKNYSRIPVLKKRTTTILLSALIILIITGVMLMFGSRSEEVSIIHYVTAIFFTLLAVGHTIKRWKLFSNLH